MSFRVVSITTLFLISFIVSGCGGGSSSSSGLLIEGTLTQGETTHHAKLATLLKHSAGESIEQVEICALGSCVLTNDEGQWGFVVESDFAGGEVLLTLLGHGIDEQLVVEIPAGAKEVFFT